MNRLLSHYRLRLLQVRRDLIALFFTLALPLTATLVAGFLTQAAGESGRAYFQLFLPGILGFTVLMFGLSGMGSYLLAERQRGIAHRFKAVHPDPGPYLGGLALSRLTLLAALPWLLAGLAAGLWGYQIGVGWWAGYVLILLASLVFLALGLLVAGISPTIEASSALSGFLQLFFIVTGGLFFSLQGWPDWLVWLLQWTPMTALTNGFAAGQQGLWALWGQSAAVLTVWAVVLGWWGWRSFRW